MSTALDFNRANLSEKPISQLINELIEGAEPASVNYRLYLGASSIGAECLRKVQFDWMCDPVFPARVKDIFARGHFFEERTRQHLIDAGFKFAPPERLKFKAADELFRGHADGILLEGPPLPGLIYPALWENKCVKDKGWKAIERDGLKGLYAVYAAQVAIYQAYLDVTNPALFSVVNADTCERLHFLVPFDAAARTDNERPRRCRDRGNACRRVAAARDREPERLEVPHLQSQGSLLGDAGTMIVLPDIAAGAIVVDAPLAFATWSRKGEGRSPQHHYACLSFEQLAAIPMARVAARHCFLFLWIPLRSVFLVEPLMQEWGFAFSGAAFAWVKQNRRSPGWFMGGGYGTRHNVEVCWLGRRGQPRRKSAGVRELIIAPVREHSRKPDEIYRRVEAFSDGPFLEIVCPPAMAGLDMCR